MSANLTVDSRFEEQPRLQNGLSKWVRHELVTGKSFSQLCEDITTFVSRLCPEGVVALVSPLQALPVAVAAGVQGGGAARPCSPLTDGDQARPVTPTKRKMLILDYLQPKRSRVVDLTKDATSNQQRLNADKPAPPA